MLKNSLVLLLLISYIFSFFIWIYWFYKSLKKDPNNKKKICLINISGFIIITYLVSFIILKVLA